MYTMCSQRLKKRHLDAFDKDEANDEIIHICLSHMKYKQIVKFYDVLMSKGFDKYWCVGWLGDIVIIKA